MRSQRATIRPSSVLVDVLTAKERIPRRRAYGKRTEAIVIKDAVCGECVDMRCFNFGVPIGAEAVDSVFVSVYDQDIRPLR